MYCFDRVWCFVRVFAVRLIKKMFFKRPNSKSGSESPRLWDASCHQRNDAGWDQEPDDSYQSSYHVTPSAITILFCPPSFPCELVFLNDSHKGRMAMQIMALSRFVLQMKFMEMVTVVHIMDYRVLRDTPSGTCGHDPATMGQYGPWKQMRVSPHLCTQKLSEFLTE